ncbi:MAG: ATP-dependent DNA helicase RecG [Chloroflexi bacterium]|nr:ATP-dependent DNA helicase RecG [Chloroflexota bacterium]
MQSSLEKLRKYFRLEAENGYKDSAIIGGLAKMLDFWEADARNEGVSEEIIRAVAGRLRDYRRLSPESREETLKGIWKRIKEQHPEAGGETSQRTQPQPPRDSAKAKESAPKRKPASRPPGRAESAPGGVTSQTPVALNASLTVLQGVGPRHAKTLEKLGLYTLGDMLYYFPRRYDDYSRLKPIKALWYGEQVTVIGTVQSIAARPIRGGKSQIVEAVVGDGTGALRLTWFNQPWLTNRIKVGAVISVSGKVDQYLGRLVMNSPDWEPVETEHLHTNRIVPIYPLTAKITQKWLRKLMKQVVTYWAPKLTDHLPESVRSSANLPSLGSALMQVHFPSSQKQLQAARERLAFDEIFFLQMGVLRQKRDWQSVTARIFDVDDGWLNSRLAGLPFELTAAQQRAVDDIVVDLGSGRPMNRLLQGDVGSGKTVVAALAVAIIARTGAQAAVMAPTGILAEQHYRSLSDLLAGSEDSLPAEAIRLLVSDTPEAEKEEIRSGLAEGSIKVVVGTHALIEGPVQFNDLQLAVIDEQHRFGVEQRAALRAKGENLHLLVMTATPIPRSLALTIHGDLDISVMDEMPAGRQPVATYVLTPQERERAYTMIRAQIKDGRQAFIIYPLIEESDKTESRAAVDDHKKLQEEVFPDLKLGLLHGRLKPAEKDAVMAKFRDGEYDILVSTTVVEVGVDVPNATVMLIEGANRFGLAQLHQLRGRVGRGSAQSYCLLIPDHEDATENERLQAMAESNDGFVLAERDLQQRGPGQFLGTRQSGYSTGLRMASLTDLQLIEKARARAQALFEEDADLQQDEHKLLAEALERFWGGGKGDVS